MNKDKIQIGDLVQWTAPYPLVKHRTGETLFCKSVGLVVSVDRAADYMSRRFAGANRYVKYRVYWFKLGALHNFNYESQLTKLSPTQEEEQNE